ncbi:cyclic-phosphate processing receiver domain-containing protein [Streptomyces sp. NRRL S-495]|uniref:cyclic-phosphate processing receiver domain-containing protein n=1 Tax=Streptomyces sp. NRRL S-495 TaxID=1609133 RepID=UPI000B092AD6|nr:cyclic-phosphate processing receiver domain-containing protein [Streptomyces sp. NRRL S-495]
MKDIFAAPGPVVLGVDDLRPLPRATRIARTSQEGVRLLEEHRDSYVDELWLDHDLGGDDTVMPVVTLLEQAAFDGRPFRIGEVLVHSANPVAPQPWSGRSSAGATASGGRRPRDSPAGPDELHGSVRRRLPGARILADGCP